MQDLQMNFPSLAGWSHSFLLRHPSIPVDAEREEVVARLSPWHTASAQALAPGARLLTAQQVHGAGVAYVTSESPAQTAGVDGLVTSDPGVLLGIYVADCCAIYFADQRTGAVGLSHSGKKGSELGIAAETLRLMAQQFGTRAEDVVVQLSPCIRPPAYEIDFASQIRTTCAAAGVPPQQIHDDLTCTSTDLSRFYSYRMEKGRTGRMLALLRARA